jgi:hypothetical protein
MIESINNVNTDSAVPGVMSVGLDNIESFTPSTGAIRPVAMVAAGIGVSEPARS